MLLELLSHVSEEVIYLFLKVLVPFYQAVNLKLEVKIVVHFLHVTTQAHL